MIENEDKIYNPYNMPGDILNSCGVCEGELMESVFEILEENTPEEVYLKLLKAGFGEDPEFTRVKIDEF